MSQVALLKPMVGFTVGNTYNVEAMNSLNYLLKSDSGEMIYVAKSHCSKMENKSDE